ncbi:sodium:solute symporter family protein [Massilia sp. TN1-12]|uniref:sodium:solute symporter family protein n=1 Tax=Massilia paldalensis TaxID=3377675 RepID=UPI0038517062
MHTLASKDTVIIVTMVGLYVALTAWLTARWRSTTASDFMVGARSLSPLVVGVLMVSEFVGTKSMIGTAQAAFESGMAASWAVLSVAVGFPLFGMVLARKLYDSGEYTISGAIFQRYGRPTQMIVSFIMIYALLLVNVGNYLSGAAVVAAVLRLDLPLAACAIALVGTFYVAFGGMKSVAYVTIWHSAMKYLGIAVVLAVALRLTGGVTPMKAALPAFYFSWDGGLGASTIVAFFIGNVGAIFSTQYIVQAISSTRSADAARRSTFVAAALALPIGIALGLIGVAARMLYPDVPSLYALPMFLQEMNVYAAGFVAVAMVASIFAGVSTVALAIASLVVRDFYLPYWQPTPARQLRTMRWIALVVGVVPLACVFLAPGLLKLSFFTRALRLSISVVAVIGLYLPHFGSGRGAACGLLAAVVTTTAWYLLGNPYGIDNMYVALATPAIVIAVERVFDRHWIPR